MNTNVRQPFRRILNRWVTKPTIKPELAAFRLARAEREDVLDVAMERAQQEAERVPLVRLGQGDFTRDYHGGAA